MKSWAEHILITVATIFLVLTTTATVLRCYVRAVLVKSFGADDALALFSLVLFIATTICVLAGAHISHGDHMINLSYPAQSKAMMWWYLCELSYIATTTCLRISIALFLYRIIVSKLHAFIIWLVMGVMTLFSISYFLFMVFQCRPANFFWMQFLGETGSCVTPLLVGEMTYLHGAFSIIADWTLAILPIFLIWNLQMNPRTKLTLAIILGMGAIGSCAVIVRFPYVVALEQHPLDFLFYSTNVVLWTSIEPGLAITASALATLRPLFQTFLSSSSTQGKNTGSRYKSTPKTGDYLKSGTGRDQRSRHGEPELNVELDDFGGEKGFTSVMKTTIMSPACLPGKEDVPFPNNKRE